MTITKLYTYTYEQFVIDAFACSWAFLRSTGQRRGQYAFNVLDKNRSDLAQKITATELDPFYDDEKIPQFLSWLQKNWGNPCVSI